MLIQVLRTLLKKIFWFHHAENPFLRFVPDMLRPGAEKGATSPDPGGQNDRRDRPYHLPVGVRRVSHILLHPLQGLLLEYDQQAPAAHRLHQRQQPAAIE